MAKFFKCNVCGQVITKAKCSGLQVSCCGKPMQELIPGTVDASIEKHVPVYEIDGNVLTVKVGSVTHPMLQEHYIAFIAVQTDKNVLIKKLTPQDAPEASFALLEGEKVIEVYEYCNLHGLWSKK